MTSSALFVIVVVTVILLAILTYMTIYGISHGHVGSAVRVGKADIETAPMYDKFPTIRRPPTTNR